jgi:hypothetical protein
MSKQSLIQAILADARRIGGNVAPRTADAAGTMYGSVKDKLAGGPKGLYEDFRTKVVSDAEASVEDLKRRQLAASMEDNVNAIVNKDENAMMSIANLLNMNTKTSNKVLGGLSNPTSRLNVAERAAQKSFDAGNMDLSQRGIRRRGAEWVAANPDTAIPVGVGTATLGTTALLTASGQALAQLTNNMNQSLATEANRENVLTS